MSYLAEYVLYGHFIVFQQFEPVHCLFIGLAVGFIPGQEYVPGEDIVDAGSYVLSGFIIEGFDLSGEVCVLFQIPCRQLLPLRPVFPLETLFLRRLPYPGQFLPGYLGGAFYLNHLIPPNPS
jgi:hypothetical protein